MKRTLYFKNKPIIVGTSTIAGPKESAGSIRSRAWLHELPPLHG